VVVLRRLLRNRFLLPAAVVLAAGLSGLFGLVGSAAPAGAQTATSSSSTNSSATTGRVTSGTAGTSVATTTSPTAAATATISAKGGLGSSRFGLKTVLACQRSIAAISYPGGANAGSPKGSDFHICSHGEVVKYGNSAIVYSLPPSSDVKVGEEMFEQTCSSCHGSKAEGSDAAPPLVGVGPATVNFWVTTGRMPAATPLQEQADRKPPKFDDQQANDIAAFINSLSPAAPYIPRVNVKAANLADGASLFALNCAACHTITGAGDELAYGTYAPTLHIATTRQVAEAIRTGPGNMPRFTGNLSDSQVRDIVAYVTGNIQHPVNPGGAGLGGIGPVTEGFVALLIGVGGFMLICFWIGDRA
jgi:quinol---cytochrome-c reductase cytochrome c subunit